MAIKLITDSGCDLDQAILDEYRIDRMPIVILDQDREYYDKVDIDETTLYENMRNGKNYKTSQVPVGIIEETFKKHLDNGDTVLYLCFSSGLSGTYQTALGVKSMLEGEYGERIHIVDSKSATAGFSTIVYLTAKFMEDTKEVNEIINRVNYLVDSIEHIFTVETMDYLYRGGRISRTQALVGGVLSIKPIIEVTAEGKLELIDKVRGNNKSIKRIYEIIEERGNDLDRQLIGIAHGDNLEMALKVKAQLEDKFNSKDFLICNIGGAIGAHAGPGTIGITFFRQVEENKN